MKKGLTRLRRPHRRRVHVAHATYSAPWSGGADSRGIRTSSSSERASSESGASNGGVFGVADSFSDDDRDGRQPQRALSCALRVARRASDDGSSPGGDARRRRRTRRRGGATRSRARRGVGARGGGAGTLVPRRRVPRARQGTASRSRCGGKRRNEADVPDFVGFFSREADPEATDASDRDGRDGSGASPSEVVGSGPSSGQVRVLRRSVRVLSERTTRVVRLERLVRFPARWSTRVRAPGAGRTPPRRWWRPNAIAGAEHVRLSPYSLLDCDGSDRGAPPEHGERVQLDPNLRVRPAPRPSTPRDRARARATGGGSRRGTTRRGPGGASANARGVASANLGDLPAQGDDPSRITRTIETPALRQRRTRGTFGFVFERSDGGYCDLPVLGADADAPDAGRARSGPSPLA